MPQARASMLVAHALQPEPGERVLDLCAAPGAKTTHMAALMRDEGKVVAVDLDPRRVRAIGENARRLGARSVEAVAGDATGPAFGADYDRVLVDPPCSDLGTLQARPDVRWRKGPEQVTELAALQGRILEAAGKALRPGGRLVYSTCTIVPAENERQIRRFLAKREDFAIVDLSDPYPEISFGGGPFLQTFPHRDGTDGFFLAALEKRSP
jgi:16S rRNA (cytosine967-C5)-methyltransferase